MAVFFAGFAVAMDLFFDPVKPAGPNGLLWKDTFVVQEQKLQGGITSIAFAGWPRSAASYDSEVAFYVVEGKITSPSVGKPLTKLTGSVLSMYELTVTPQGGIDYFWQVDFGKGIKASELLASPSLGKSMQLVFSGNDEINGSNESDTLYGFKGNDKLAGNLGDDFFLIDSVGDKIIEKENEGDDTAVAYVSYDAGAASLTSVEYLYCISKCKVLSGNKTDNFIIGNESKNKLNGRSGNDVLYATSPHPLKPDAGPDAAVLEADVLSGGAGNDLLFGFGGKDKLTGGNGTDIFVFDTPPEKKFAAQITDFNAKEDRIGLCTDLAYKNLTYIQVSGFSREVRQNYFSKSPAIALRYTELQASEFAVINNEKNLDTIGPDQKVIYVKNNGKLFYDKDGSGAAEAKPIATLAKNLSLTDKNVLLIGEADAFPGVYKK